MEKAGMWDMGSFEEYSRKQTLASPILRCTSHSSAANGRSNSFSKIRDVRDVPCAKTSEP